MFEANIDKEVLEVISRLYNRESPFVVLDTLKDLARDRKIKNRIEKVKYRIVEGESLITAIYNEGLISKKLYEYLKGAENNRNLDKFAKEKLRTDKQIAKIVRELIFSLISPVMAFFVSIGVVYIFVYKVLPAFNLREKQLAYLPSYFPYLIDLSRHPYYYLAFIIAIISIFGIAYYLRTKVPLLSPIYLMYERLKLYIHLYLSVKAMYNIDEALRNYNGELKTEAEKILLMIEEGEDLTSAFIKTFNKVYPLEKPLLLAAIKTGEEKDLKDLQDEVMELMKTKLETVKQVLTIVSLLFVASVILFSYGGILMPIMKAMRSMMN